MGLKKMTKADMQAVEQAMAALAHFIKLDAKARTIFADTLASSYPRIGKSFKKDFDNGWQY
jgi:hypothetical protein